MAMDRPTTKRIKALVRVEHGTEAQKDGKGPVSVYMPGDELELEGGEAERLIARGFAELVEKK